MYHNIWGNILMYCESNNIKLGDLVVDIFHNTSDFQINNFFCIDEDVKNFNIPLEYVINLLSEKIDVPIKDILFPDNYNQKVADFIEDKMPWSEHVKVYYDDKNDKMIWNDFTYINSGTLDMTKILDVHTLEYTYEVLLYSMNGMNISDYNQFNKIYQFITKPASGNCISLYDSQYNQSTGVVEKYIDNFFKHAEIWDDDGEKIIYDGTSILDFNDVVVKSSIRKCMNEEDLYQSISMVSAVVFILNDHGDIEVENIPLVHCKVCNTYYMYEDQYNSLCKKGTPLLRTYTLQQFKNKMYKKDIFSSLNPESIFKICGYTVDANIGMSDAARHNLLNFLIKRNIVSLTKTLNFLHWLIDSRKDMIHMQNAVQKWKNDLDYITKQYTDHDETFVVTSIKTRT